jgi:hypothetical protein
VILSSAGLASKLERQGTSILISKLAMYAWAQCLENAWYLNNGAARLTALEIVAKSLPTPLRRSAPPTKWGITERCQVGPFTPVIKPADSQLAYIVSCCAYLLECFPSRLTEVEITI